VHGSEAVVGRLRTGATVGAAAIAAAVLLSGCSAVAHPSPATTPPATAAMPSPDGVPPSPSAAPVLHPDSSAEDNLPLFTAVVKQVWAGEGRASGRAYVDALAAAGFARTDMQVTADESTVGNPAESIQFSVRWGQGGCLVGQVGPSTGDPVTMVLPQLDGGRCLIGKTAPIEP